MAYDRYDARRDGRESRSRWQGDDRFERGGWSRDRDNNDRGWFERAGDEIASWFGDEDAERRRRRDNPDRDWGRDHDRFSGHLRNEDDIRDYYEHRGQRQNRDWNRDRPSAQRFQGERDYGDRTYRSSGESRGYGSAFMSDDDFGSYERRPRWRDEGYRRPYTGRFSGGSGFGGERGDGGYRPMAGDYSRGGDRTNQPFSPSDYSRGGGLEGVSGGGAGYGAANMHDRHYGQLRQRHLEDLDRDYDDYARENQSRFESDFTGWRERRQQKRGLLGQVREHMEVLGSDGEHVGTVDRTAGDRIILTKSDEDSGGSHHSLMCTSIDRVEGDKVFLDTSAEDAKKQWRDENRDRALFEREDQGEAGPGVLNRSFSGTY